MSNAPEVAVYDRAICSWLIARLRSEGARVLAPVRDKAAVKRALDAVERTLRASADGKPANEPLGAKRDKKAGAKRYVEELNREYAVEFCALAENGLTDVRENLALVRARREQLPQRAVDREGQERMLRRLEADLLVAEESSLRKIAHWREVLASHPDQRRRLVRVARSED
jgi:hypothetical protein